MPRRVPPVALALLVVVGVLVLGVVAEEFAASSEGDRALVTVVDADGRALGTIEVRLAETARERYVGLSETDALGPDEGMLFVHDEEAEYAYVMRRMAFPIDIVFIDADHRITTIHHAEVESPPLTRYRGRGRWVLEVPSHWTTDHGVSVGDRVRIDSGP